MKKGFMIILTFILSFICMMGVVKASTIEKTCTYRLYSENDRSSDAYYDFDIIYKLVDNKEWSIYFNTSDGANQSVLIYNNGTTNDRIEVMPYNGITSNMRYIYADVEKQQYNFGFFYAEKSGLVSKDSSGNYKFNSCLPIYYRETQGISSDSPAYFSVTVNNILDAYHNQYDVANPIDKKTGESLIKDPDKDYKKCHLQIKESDAYCDSSLISSDRIITLDINTSPTGEVKIYLNDKIMTEKDGGLQLKLLNGTGVNLKHYNFIITAEELTNIKKIYKYTTNTDSSTCASVYFSIQKRNVNDVYISTTKSSNTCSSEASVNVTLNPDKKNENSNGNGKIDNSLGTCVLLLGSASEDNTVANFLYKIFQIMKIVSIIIVITMCMFDMAKSVTTNKDDLMPTVQKCGKRLILLFVLLFLPTIIDLAGNIVGKEDILCGIK